MSHRRTGEIDAAIQKVKKRSHGCLACRNGFSGDGIIVGAHLVGRNTPYAWNDPADPDLIIPLCPTHHASYDKNTAIQKRILWLKENGLRSHALLLRVKLNPRYKRLLGLFGGDGTTTEGKRLSSPLFKKEFLDAMDAKKNLRRSK